MQVAIHTPSLKYECSSIWKSNASSPVLLTFNIVCRPALPNVTLYTRLNLSGQAFFASSDRCSESRPKSSFTASSPPLERAPDSEDDLPRYSHVELRAKPCWGRAEVAWSFGGGPKTCIGRDVSMLPCDHSRTVMRVVHCVTGKTTGMPPLTGLEPSSFASSLSQRFSLPLLFQLITVAPYSSTTTESPVGRVA